MCMDFGADERRSSVLKTLTEFFVNNGELDDLKDYLADLKDKGTIKWCGCDGLFETRMSKSGDILVFMEGINCVEKYVINDKPYFELSTFAEAIPNYGEITENKEF